MKTLLTLCLSSVIACTNCISPNPTAAATTATAGSSGVPVRQLRRHPGCCGAPGKSGAAPGIGQPGVQPPLRLSRNCARESGVRQRHLGVRRCPVHRIVSRRDGFFARSSRRLLPPAAAAAPNMPAR